MIEIIDMFLARMAIIVSITSFIMECPVGGRLIWLAVMEILHRFLSQIATWCKLLIVLCFASFMLEFFFLLLLLFAMKHSGNVVTCVNVATTSPLWHKQFHSGSYSHSHLRRWIVTKVC